MSGDDIDIVERLRRLWDWLAGSGTAADELLDAADEIERLRAEVERLRAAGDAMAAIVGDVVVPFDDVSKAWTMATAYGTWREARRERP